MEGSDDIEQDPTTSDVAGRSGDVGWSDDVPDLAVGGDGHRPEPSDVADGWCPEDGDLGIDLFTPLDSWASGDDELQMQSRVDDSDSPSGGDRSAGQAPVSGHEVSGPGDDLGAAQYDDPGAEGHGTVLRDDPPGNLGPLGFDVEERGPIEQAEHEASQADVPYAPIADRELAAHAHEIEVLHGFDFAHAEVEHDVQQSFDARLSSPVWLSHDEVANSECELSQAVAQGMDDDFARIQHEQAEAHAGASLVPPEIAAHMQQLDALGLEADVAHAASEVSAQQSQPTEPVDYEPLPGSGTYWGVRVVGGASVSMSPARVGPSFDKAVLEIKNLTTGQVGVFESAGLGIGLSTPSADVGTGEWAVFRTADDQRLDDFAGRASLSNVSVLSDISSFDTASAIRFSDPDSWLPLVGDIDVVHDNLADSIALGDSVEITDSANHAGVGISSSTVWLSLAWSYWEAPEPDLGDIVRDALRDVGGDR